MEEWKERLKEGRRYLYVSLIFIILANVVIILGLSTWAWQEYTISVTNTNGTLLFAQKAKYSLFGNVETCTTTTSLGFPDVGCEEGEWDNTTNKNLYAASNIAMSFLLTTIILSLLFVIIGTLHAVRKENFIMKEKMTSLAVAIMGAVMFSLTVGAVIFFPLLSGNEVPTPYYYFFEATVNQYDGWSYWIQIISCVFMFISFIFVIVDYNGYNELPDRIQSFFQKVSSQE